MELMFLLIVTSIDVLTEKLRYEVIKDENSSNRRMNKKETK